MYAANQTLRHVKTNQLVALHPSPQNQSAWNWELDCFIDENGTVFKDNINNYTHIEDWFGTPLCGTDRTINKFVDVTLKQFIVSDYKRNRERKKAFEIWEKELLTKLESSKSINHPFSNSCRQYKFEKFFLKRRKAKPLCYYFSQYKFEPKKIPFGIWFKYKGQNWLYLNTTNSLVRMIK